LQARVVATVVSCVAVGSTRLTWLPPPPGVYGDCVVVVTLDSPSRVVVVAKELVVVVEELVVPADIATSKKASLQACVPI